MSMRFQNELRGRICISNRLFKVLSGQDFRFSYNSRTNQLWIVELLIAYVKKCKLQSCHMLFN